LSEHRLLSDDGVQRKLRYYNSLSTYSPAYRTVKLLILLLFQQKFYQTGRIRQNAFSGARIGRLYPYDCR
jgi:hypothetical protein